MTTMTNRTNTTTHVYVGECRVDPLRCDHESGEFSFRIIEGIWLTGTPADFRMFAERMAQFADELTREASEQFDTASSASRQHYIDTGRYLTHAEVGEWSDRADFDESRASDEVWS